MPLLIEPRQERSITTIRLVGSILRDDGTAALTRSLRECLTQTQVNLLLEVADVQQIDQTGVDTLRTTQLEAKEAGGDLKIAGASASFLAVLAVYDSAALFPYYADTEQALAAFGAAQEGGTKGVKHFDILEFVKEQEKEEQEQAVSASSPSSENPVSE